MHAPLAASLLFFIGTNTPPGGTSRGIYAARLDPATGAISTVTLAAEAKNPGFLAWHPDGRTLYALGSGPDAAGGTSGGAAAFAFEPADGTLTARNARGTGGSANAHLVVDATGRALAVASYGGGTLSTFALAPDGSLGPLAAHLPITGATGPNRRRQEKPHPHSVTLSPDNRHLYLCDLGLDLVLAFELDPATGALRPLGRHATAPGAGPRHAKFSPDGRFLYVLNELSATIEVFARDAGGALTRTQSVATLPAEFTGDHNTSAEIRLHPNGRFVYASNRGHDSLAVLARDPDSGALTLIENVPSGGAHPRNFALTPDGAWLVCANRDSHNLVSFRVDPATGRLTPSGHTAAAPHPICLAFAP